MNNSTPTGYVYAIRAAAIGYIKIGYSIDPAFRLNHLQIGSPDKLELIATWPATEDEEHQLHRHLKPWRLHGEWFEPSEAVWAIIKHCHAKQRTDLAGIDLTRSQAIRKIALESRLQGCCCFCRKPRNEVFRLVRCEGVWICETCIEFCSNALLDQKAKAA